MGRQKITILLWSLAWGLDGVASSPAIAQDAVTPTPYATFGATTPLPSHPPACQSMLDTIGSCKTKEADSYASCIWYGHFHRPPSSPKALLTPWLATTVSANPRPPTTPSSIAGLPTVHRGPRLQIPQDTLVSQSYDNYRHPSSCVG